VDLENLNGFENRYIFCMWLGIDKLPKDHAAELFSIVSNTHCPVVFLNIQSYKKWEHPSAPFHPAFEFLSEVQRTDYLRVYLMHHYGGGYSDIKFTYLQWDEAFEKLHKSDAWVLGYEIGTTGEFGLSKKWDGTELLANYKKNYAKFGIGHVAFMFKKKTPLTHEMYKKMVDTLDEKFEELRENPSKIPKDSKGRSLPDNTISKYPLDYIEIGPDIFHMTLNNHKDKIIHHEIRPLHVYHFDLDIPGFAEKKKEYKDNHISIWPFDLDL